MTAADIIRYRLLNQQIAQTKFTRPEEIVGWLGAIQAQEFAMAKWAIGLRWQGTVTDAAIEKAFNEGLILRTHLLRPTWHFVTPADIRWMQMLTAPRVHAGNASICRKLELDDKIFKRTHTLLARALEGKKYLTRDELRAILLQKKINVSDGLRLAYILMKAELDCIICSGPRIGRQFTYALLDERIKSFKPMTRKEAMAAFALRFFTSRGPATIQDLAYWSSLTIKDAKECAATIPSSFIREKVNGQEYIFKPVDLPGNKKGQTTFLMPEYDEYGMSYKDRSIYFNSRKPIAQKHNPAHRVYIIVIDGMMGGAWQRIPSKKEVAVEVNAFGALNKRKQQELARAVKAYNTFSEVDKG